MSDVKKPLQPTPNLPSAFPEKGVDQKVNVPKEFRSKGNSVVIVQDEKKFTIEFSSEIAREVGAYHRCKVRLVAFENGEVKIIPYVPA